MCQLCRGYCILLSEMHRGKAQAGTLSEARRCVALPGGVDPLDLRISRFRQLVWSERYIEKPVGTSLEHIGEDDPEDKTITPEDIEMQGKVVYVIQTVNG